MAYVNRSLIPRYHHHRSTPVKQHQTRYTKLITNLLSICDSMCILYARKCLYFVFLQTATDKRDLTTKSEVWLCTTLPCDWF